MTEVKIRQVEESDFKFIHDTLYNTWYKEENQNEALAYALAEIDLNHTLNRSSFGLIAEVNGQSVGFILARINTEQPLLRLLQSNPYQSLMTILNASPAEQADNLAYLKREQEINEDMVKQAGTDFEAEISLFIVDSNTRGMGIGKELFQKVKQHFEEHNVKDYFLFTDDACDYQFYGRNQMHRAQTRPYQKEDSIENSSFNFYLYENDG